MYSCFRHSGGWQLGVEGTTATFALQAFFTRQTQQRTWLQNATYPCSACCDPPP